MEKHRKVEHHTIGEGKTKLEVNPRYADFMHSATSGGLMVNAEHQELNRFLGENGHGISDLNLKRMTDIINTSEKRSGSGALLARRFVDVAVKHGDEIKNPEHLLELALKDTDMVSARELIMNVQADLKEEKDKE